MTDTDDTLARILPHPCLARRRVESPLIVQNGLRDDGCVVAQCRIFSADPRGSCHVCPRGSCSAFPALRGEWMCVLARASTPAAAPLRGA